MGKKLTVEKIDELSKDINTGFDTCSICKGVEIANSMYSVNDNSDDFDLICEECSEKSNNKKKDEIEKILIRMIASMGMDIPANYEDIVQFCFEDVHEVADKENWNDSDVTIAFRRWIESRSEKEEEE